MRHLDDELYRQIKERPQDVPSEVYRHLREECATCAAYLAALPPEQRDGRIDDLLREPEGAQLPAFHIAPPKAERRGPPFIIAVGLVVGVFLMFSLVERFFVARTLHGPREIPPEAPPVKLVVTVTHADGKTEPVQSGAALRENDVLHASAELPRAALVSLVRAGDGAGFEPLMFNQQGKAGEQVLLIEDKPSAIPLDGLHGHQHLFALTCDRPLTIDEAISASKGFQPTSVGASAFDFTVEK